jgi:hypothetical protein
MKKVKKKCFEPLSDLKSPKTPKTVTFLGEDMFFLVMEIASKWKEYKILDCFDILSGKTGK